MRSWLANLDPSHFQNVILGILAIYLPFAIVFLTDVVSQKQNIEQNPKAEFERTVLQDEVFKVKSFFIVSISAVAIFAFFSAETCGWGKLLAIALMVIFSIWLWRHFARLLKYSKGRNEKLAFELSYLRSLGISRFWLTFANVANWLNKKFKLNIFKKINAWSEGKLKVNIEKITGAWRAVWQAEDESGFEQDFLDCFSAHVNALLKKKQPDHAKYLLHIYTVNIAQRNLEYIENEIFFKKILAWVDDFTSLREWDFTSCTGLIKSFTKQMSGKTYFPTQIYAEFEIYISSHIKELEQASVNNLKNKVFNLREKIDAICTAFYQPLFNHIQSFRLDNFPQDWQIHQKNVDNVFSKIALHQFLMWAKDKIFKTTDFNRELSNVMSMLFNGGGNIQLFSAFLKIYFTFDKCFMGSSGYIKLSAHENLEEILVKRNNFMLCTNYMAQMYDRDDLEIDKKIDDAEIANTLQIMFKYHWQSNLLNRIEWTDESAAEYNNATIEQKHAIAKLALTEKWQSWITALKSQEIINFCQIDTDEENASNKENNRQNMLFLFECMIKELENGLPVGIF